MRRVKEKREPACTGFPDIIYQLHVGGRTPIPVSLDASVARTVFRSIAKYVSTGTEIRRDCAPTKAWSCLGNPWNTAFFHRRQRKGAIIYYCSEFLLQIAKLVYQPKPSAKISKGSWCRIVSDIL